MLSLVAAMHYTYIVEHLLSDHISHYSILFGPPVVFSNWSNFIPGKMPKVGLSLEKIEYFVLILDQDKDSHASLKVAAMEQKLVLGDLVGH